MRFEDANDMLRPGYLPFDSRYQELEDGSGWSLGSLACPDAAQRWWIGGSPGSATSRGTAFGIRLTTSTAAGKTASMANTSAHRILSTNISPGRTAPFTSYVWTFTTPPRRSSRRSGIVRPGARGLRTARALGGAIPCRTHVSFRARYRLWMRDALAFLARHNLASQFDDHPTRGAGEADARGEPQCGVCAAAAPT